MTRTSMATKKTKQDGKKRGAGRRPGTDTTHDEILQHARTAFGASGFDGTSLRAIAIKAGVDPSTVIHFFGTKEGLFEAVIRDVAPASQPLIDALKRRAPGEELVRCYMQIWETDGSSGAARAVIRTSLSSSKASELLRETLTMKLLQAAAPTAPLETEIAISHLIGLGLGRHILALPELCAADIDTLAQRVGPILDHYLYGAGRPS